MISETRKARKRNQQREEILVAARERFLEDGHARFSMRGLATALDCAPGTLYLYFRDKDAIIACLVEESFEHLMDELEASRADAHPLKFLREMMRAYITFGLTHPDHYYFAFMLQRTKRLEEERPRPHRSFAMLRHALEACIEQGLLGPADVDLATRGVWTALHGVTSLMITIPNFPWGDEDAVVDHVIESTLRGLQTFDRPATDGEGASDVDRP